jgi:hypothetical protein
MIQLLRSNIAYLILLLALGTNLHAQYPQLNKLPSSGETIDLFTDRSIYITGEEIQFRINYTHPEGEYLTHFSRVMYVELIKWNGNKLSQVKVPLLNGHTHGSVPIPLDIESGNYYLRAYTKWMRNYSQYDYAYILVKVVNPKTKNTDERPTAGTAVIPDKRGRSSDRSDFLELDGLKEAYEKGEMVSFDLLLSENAVKGPYWISATRASSNDPQVRSFTFGDEETDYTGEPIEFLPELRGLTLSGKALDRKSGQSLKNSRVYLSSVGDAKYFSSARTDSAGNFLFTFPRLEQELEFHLTSEQETAELLIDTDFCNRPVTLAFVPFFLEEGEKALVGSLSRIAQLEQRFIPDNFTLTDTLPIIPFYGKANRTINEKEFIELDDLEEFFFELVYEVSVRRKDGKAFLEIQSQSTLSSYPVLVLMDNIPVRDIDELLKVSCRRVDRIEILDRGYVLGESLHSGIVSIFSERGDMAGIRLGEDSYFFSLRMMEYPPEADTDQDPYNSPWPVIKNTLYWQPELEMKRGEKSAISFPAGDFSGSFELTVCGMNEETGELVYMTKTFNVE